ncbi:PPOX class probable F420-dependent enzyme/PPOX class probable F420-dependent enzyme, Rv2061 family [Micromonospora viridifaciens]|uniref:PPOX class probable F420-dependent enzyme/PPOX class probable F420-dependent enzyme, Rv2061 family n=1 Tax=Micromonospora viridifaciens TaxID=1881 RepID=A0A1C5A1M9_MICVI|nr:PPOX class F420-dependent oxidoreductase [Micromonospora viridifaciens]SCF39059.1 PPOX class probable F420-dependent enzyme/PPOX class probable F420-dependent enzyme, Rv2061 family [Micromonospora viridifaciens]
MAILTEEDLALLREPQLAHVATIEADGTPHVTPVWVDTDGEHIVFNTVKGRKKHRNIARNPAVAVSVVDKANDFRTLWVKGTAELVNEGADEHIDRLAKKYLGQDTYPFRQPGEERVIVRITPTEKLGRG